MTQYKSINSFISDFLKNPYPLELPSEKKKYRPTEILFLTLIITTVYFVLAYFSLVLAKTTMYRSVSAIWLPAGIASYALLRFGRRALPGIFAGSILANAYISANNPEWILWVSIGNMIGPWLAIEALRLIDQEWTGFHRVKGAVSYLITVAWLNGIVSGGFAAAGSLIFRGFRSPGMALEVWWSWTISDIFAILSFGTLIIMHGFKPRNISRKDMVIFRSMEAGVIVMVTLFFFVRYHIDNPMQSAAGLIIIPLLWAETRFPIEKVYKFASIIFMAGATSSAYGFGPYQGFWAIPPETMFQLMALGLLSVLLIGGAVEEERFRAKSEIVALNRSLENDVKQRTRQISELLNHERSVSAIKDALLKNTTAGVGLVNYPERNYMMVNEAFLDIMGYSDEKDVIGKNVRMIYPNDDTYKKVGLVAKEVLKNGSGTAKGVPLRKADGNLIYIDLSAVRVWNNEVSNFDGGNFSGQIIWTLIDVTERHRLSEELAWQALYDPLTSLPNRRALNNTLGKAIARTKRYGKMLAIVITDLDNFKPINDIYGHENGDKVLCVIANRFKDSLRKTDFVARFGGDEFVLVIENLNYEKELTRILTKLETTVKNPVDIGEAETVSVGISMGVAIYSRENGQDNPDILLRYADQALYASKENKARRKRCWTVHDDKILR